MAGPEAGSLYAALMLVAAGHGWTLAAARSDFPLWDGVDVRPLAEVERFRDRRGLATHDAAGAAAGRRAGRDRALTVRYRSPMSKKLPRAEYEQRLSELHLELVKLQSWARESGERVVCLFEGRDAAGKGGTIKRIMEPLNPRFARIVALGTPTERERTQWYFQRYVEHLPAAGEIVLFDRSWYNRAGVERVMGFCTDEEYWEFLHSAPEFERMLVRDGIQLRKYWFSISRRRAGAALPAARAGPAQALEAEPDGHRVARPLGRLLARQGRDVPAHAHARGARGTRSRATTSGARG